jgi:PilZ domain
MQTTTERRINGATRLPLDAIVEVGVGTENAFEAQAIDVSSHGMHLKTAYLPEVGQPMTCRFEAGLKSVIAEGRVAWRQDAENGGDFGLEFASLDEASRAALTQILRASNPKTQGARVRLHIEGLGSPMRARIRSTEGSQVTAFSELGFLKVGKELELEDASNGQKRPAEIEQVDVELDPRTKIPQLIVSMRYADEQAAAADSGATVAKEGTPEPSTIDGRTPPSTATEFDDVKSPFARSMAKVTPALLDFAGRAKSKAQELWKNRTEPSDASAPRRTTAPPPGGGLHATGRRVVRGGAKTDSATGAPEATFAGAPAAAPWSKNKRRATMGAAVVVAGALAYAGLRKSDVPKDTTASAATSAALPVTAETMRPIAVAPAAPLQPAALSLPHPIALSSPAVPASPAQSDTVGVSSPGADDSEAETPTRAKPQPFGHGNVTHGTVLHLKMDGNIERIQGAMQPTGFTVVVPKRRALTSAGAISKQDKRIGQTKLINDVNGSELSITFKDGVPPYVVRAKKDILEVVLGNAPGDDKGDAANVEAKHAPHAVHRRHDTKHGHKKH